MQSCSISSSLDSNPVQYHDVVFVPSVVQAIGYRFDYDDYHRFQLNSNLALSASLMMTMDGAVDFSSIRQLCSWAITLRESEA